MHAFKLLVWPKRQLKSISLLVHDPQFVFCRQTDMILITQKDRKAEKGASLSKLGQAI